MAWVRNRGTTRKKRWYINYVDEHDDPVEKPCSQPTREEAQKFADAVEAKCERIRLGVEKAALPDWTIRELAERYFEDVLPTKADPKLREGVIRNHVIAHLGDTVFHRLLPVDVDRWQEMLKKRPRGAPGKSAHKKRAHEPLSPKTVLNARNLLSAMFRYAQKKLKLDVSNPVLDADPIQLEDPDPNPVEIEHLGPILANVEPEWMTLFITAVCLGPRKGELAGLLCGDVDLDRQLIKIWRSYDKLTTKTKRTRLSVIPIFLVPGLRAQIAGRPPDAILFPEHEVNEDDEIIEVMMTTETDLVAVLKAAIKKAGIIDRYEYTCRKGKSRGRHGTSPEVSWGCGRKLTKKVDEKTDCAKCQRRMWSEAIPVHYTFKDLRATFATYALESSGDLDFVQRQIGHQEGSSVTKLHYAKLRAQRMVVHADRLPFKALLPGGFAIAEDQLPFDVGSGDENPVSQLPGPRNRPVASATNLYQTPTRQMTEDNEKHPDLTKEYSPIPSTSNPKAAGSTPAGRTRETPRTKREISRGGVARPGGSEPFGSLLPGAGSKALPRGTKPRLRVVDGGADRILTVKQVAEHLALSTATVYAFIERGELPCSRFASQIRVSLADLEAFIDRHSVPKGSP